MAKKTKSGKKKGGYGCQSEPQLQTIEAAESNADAWPPSDWCAADSLMAAFGLERVRGDA